MYYKYLNYYFNSFFIYIVLKLIYILRQNTFFLSIFVYSLIITCQFF